MQDFLRYMLGLQECSFELFVLNSQEFVQNYVAFLRASFARVMCNSKQEVLEMFSKARFLPKCDPAH